MEIPWLLTKSIQTEQREFIKLESCHQDRILKKCEECRDVWAEEISMRLSSCIDLGATDAVYHVQCKSNFLTGKDVPGHRKPEKTPGRPSNQPMKEAFEKLL